jgi:hypothetical protein
MQTMRNKKIKDLLKLTVQSAEEMSVDPNFDDWSAESIFQVATEVALNEYSATGDNSPVASVDTSRFAFSFNENEEEMDVIMIHGESLFDDED